MSTEPTNQTTSEPAVVLKRLVRPGPRTFAHFPEDMVCPVCGTNADGQTVLVCIDGTQKGWNAEAAPTHLACAVADHLSIKARVMYRQLDEGWTYPPNVPAQRPPAKDI
jgi:hypothetical protein